MRFVDTIREDLHSPTESERRLLESAIPVLQERNRPWSHGHLACFVLSVAFLGVGLSEKAMHGIALFSIFPISIFLWTILKYLGDLRLSRCIRKDLVLTAAGKCRSYDNSDNLYYVCGVLDTGNPVSFYAETEFNEALIAANGVFTLAATDKVAYAMVASPAGDVYISLSEVVSDNTTLYQSEWENLGIDSGDDSEHLVLPLHLLALCKLKVSTIKKKGAAAI